jgi:hypothetical protein
MSKGHGAVQRRLLSALEESPRHFEVFELAGLVYDVPPDKDGCYSADVLTEAMLASVRRALARLTDEGQIKAWRIGNRIIRAQCWWSARNVDAPPTFSVRFKRDDKAK